MLSCAEVLALIDHIYAAALVPNEQGAWRDLLVLSEQYLHGGRALLTLQDEHSAQVSFFNAPHFEVAAIQAYADYFSAINPWTRNMARLPEGHIHSGDMMVPERDLVGTEFYNDWLKPQGFHCGGGCTILKDHGRMMIFSFLKPKGAVSVTETEFDLMHKLLPHFQRAAQVRRQFSEVEFKLIWATHALSRLSFDVLLVGPSRRVITMNQAAADLLRCVQSLFISPMGEIRARRAHEDNQLLRLLQGAQKTADHRGLHAGGTLTILGSSQDPAICVLIAPFNPCLDLPTHHGPYVTILLKPRRLRPAPDADILCALYGLTKAEAHVLSALAQGKPIRSIAASRRVSVSTVRNQVQQLLEKTGTHRQSSLVAKVLADVDTTG